MKEFYCKHGNHFRHIDFLSRRLPSGGYICTACEEARAKNLRSRRQQILDRPEARRAVV